MDLTWVAASSFLLVGVGYAVVHSANRFRVVCWALLCASLFALSTRDLFRTRERGPPAPAPSGAPTNRPDDESRDRSDEPADRPPTDRSDADRPAPRDGERDRPPLTARVRGRVAGWFG